MSPATCHACGKAAELAWIDVAPRSPGDPPDFVPEPGAEGYRRASLCEGCFEAIDPDMLSCRAHYESLNPVTPFPALPRCPT